MYPFFVSDFNETWFFWQIFEKSPKYHIEWKSVQWKARCSMRTHRHKTKLMAFEAIEWECRVDWFGAGYGSWVSILLTSLCHHTEIICFLFRKIITCTWLSNIGKHDVPKQSRFAGTIHQIRSDFSNVQYCGMHMADPIHLPLFRLPLTMYSWKRTRISRSRTNQCLYASLCKAFLLWSHIPKDIFTKFSKARHDGKLNWRCNGIHIMLTNLTPLSAITFIVLVSTRLRLFLPYAPP